MTDTFRIAHVPYLYKHQKPTTRLLSYARQRRREIDETMIQLKLEAEVMDTIIAYAETITCRGCGDTGEQLYQDGDEMLYRKCSVCGGKGKTKA